MKMQKTILIVFVLFLVMGFSPKKKVINIHLIGDSTMANYVDNYDPGKDYMKTRYPMTGWGQVFQPYFTKDKLYQYKGLFNSDSVVVNDWARGGRSTRTFFQEGRWRKVFDTLQKGDLVLMQFGHNDASEKKTERYVNVQGYKEFLRLFVTQARQKGAIPIVVTPVARNYPWVDGELENVHGNYPEAAKEISIELNALFIDLNTLSMNAFSEVGEDYAANNYFMNLEPGRYEAYPDGLKDNTHFQPAGADLVAKIVAEAMKKLSR